MTYLVSIDPGMSTGVVLGEYDDTTPYKRLAYWQIEGGLNGLLDWLDEMDLDAMGGSRIAKYLNWAEWVSERFVLQNNEFVANIEPVRIEGALTILGFLTDRYPDPHWQRPGAMYFCGGKTLAERKGKAQLFLKKHGLWLTGKDVGRPDANDANSAQLHAFAFLHNHLPTVNAYRKEDQE